jgi:hypothetical protein
MKKSILTLSLVLFSLSVFADEGMWLVNLLNKQMYATMKSKGLKLTPDEIYNEGGTSLKDAIVALDGGMCSGSVISANGLMITNHHCAYGDIHALSTPAKNYLEDGFWAMKQDDEIPIKGKTVTFLRRVLDVTDEVNTVIDSLDKTGPRSVFFGRRLSAIMEKRYSNQPYEVSLNSMWRGSKYYMFFYETYSDVRLVGAPPVSIGAYGGETDNWGWPQHKGDFAIYRIYTSKEGKPAEYSPDNVPMQPKKYLTVSAAGVKNNDFTMVLGYPGTTNRYASSYEIQEKFSVLNPIISGVRRAKLEVWKKYMDADPVTRLKYSDKYFNISNYTDYAKWENKCIARFHVINELQAREKELQAWINANPERTAKYGTVLQNLKKGYEIKANITKIREYFRESMIRGPEFLNMGQRMNSLGNNLLKAKKENFSMKDEEVNSFVTKIADVSFTQSSPVADKELFIVMLNYFLKEVPDSFYNPDFKKVLDSLGRNSQRFADYIYDNSIITDSMRMRRFFNSPRTLKDLFADPIISVVKTLGIREYNAMEDSLLDAAKIDLSKERGLFVKAMYEMKNDKGIAQYPDANSTMRLTYGTVGPIEPYDAVYYHYQSSSQGIMEKYNPADYEFNLTSRMQDLLQKGDWGKWGQNGKLYIDFLSDNDITGGNSGSPVMNAKGELIGLAFDGNRESMAGDVFFKNGYNKMVSVDIRYVLWIIEKYAGASNIINELNIKFK